MLMRNVLGMGLRSSAYSSGPLLVSVIIVLVSHTVFWTRQNHYYLNCFKSAHAAIASIWVVLKQRRMMTREDAIVEEAAMNGIGLKKRHVFPLAVGIVFFILLAMFMVWKRMTWILLIGANVALFAHFVYLRRKAKKAGQGGEGYIQDAGLEIS